MEWISIKGRLPESCRYYLVCHPRHPSSTRYDSILTIAKYYSDNTWSVISDQEGVWGGDFTDGFYPELITHWMPLPEPPKG